MGCRAKKKQSDLVRLALINNDVGPTVVIDEKRRLGGRGAWLCRGHDGCLAEALKKRAFARAFRTRESLNLTNISALSGG